jgi:hypothetical protein
VSAPAWLRELLGWKPATKKSAARCVELFGDARAPNLADVGGKESLRIAGAAYVAMGIVRETTTTLTDDISDAAEADGAVDSGSTLERGIEADIKASLATLDDSRRWIVRRERNVAKFAQFGHLESMQILFDQYPELRATLGRDYQVKTDVYVGVEHPSDPAALPFLHAAISSKWSIRSDRVQNVRHEFATLVRNRRGRLPHLVLVTAEPLPSRLLSIARGTGEVDAVYHLMFDELGEAVDAVAGHEQKAAWAEMVGQRRLRPYTDLAVDLTLS